MIRGIRSYVKYVKVKGQHIARMDKWPANLVGIEVEQKCPTPRGEEKTSHRGCGAEGRHTTLLRS